MDRLDVIIFGVTGYTGKNTVYWATKILKGMKWGVAGRNEDKIQQIMIEMSVKSGIDLSAIPIFTANVKNLESLKSLASKTKILMNAVGPYRFYGEPVIKACIDQNCHYVDVTAEPQFMEKMQLLYHKIAEEKGIFLVSACGFDSVPADMGTIFMEQQFEGSVNSLEVYMRVYLKKLEAFRPMVNYGTWESIMYVFSHRKELSKIREKIYPNGFPKFEPRLKNRFIIHKPSFMEHFSIPYPGIDRSVITRSQRFLYNYEKKRPIQVKAYVTINSFVQLIVAGIVGALFIVLSKLSCGRYLLKKHPRILSLGLISKEGPSEETMKNTKFEFTFHGEGWKDPTDQYKIPLNKEIVTRVSSEYSGYEITCIAFLLAAKTILNESSKMPGKGGVLSPGAAFAKTNYISELQNHGLKFEVINQMGK